MIKVLCAALGLAETATGAEVLAAVQALQSRAALNAAGVDLAAYAPRADFSAMEARALAAEQQIAALNAASLKQEAEAAVDEAIKNRKIVPASRDEHLALCSSREGLESVKAILAASPAVISAETQAPAGAAPAGGGANGVGLALNAEESEVAKAMGYTEEEFKKIKGGAK